MTTATAPTGFKKYNPILSWLTSYKPGSGGTGTLHVNEKVIVDLEEDDVSHLEPEEHKYHRILARQ